MSLEEALDQIKPPPPPERAPSEAWRPHSDIGDDGGVIVTVPYDAGTGESDTEQILADHGLTPSQWKVTSYRRSTWQAADGKWLEATRLSIAPVRPGKRFGVDLPDLDDLDKLIDRTAHRVEAPALTDVQQGVTIATLLADPQIGKVDTRGGITEFLARDEASRQNWTRYVESHRPEEILILDAGDIIEGFESAPNADRLNDLSLTEQIRVARRVVWKWVATAATLAPRVVVASVGSNHGRVRRGKQNMGAPDDDFGVEINAQLADMAATHPEKYGHVEFYTPGKWEETLSLTASGGKVIGLAHSHQARGQAGIGAWWAGQLMGRKPLAGVDILFTGHWHNFRVETVGDDRWIFGCPAMESGSSWYSNISGSNSSPAVLALVVDPDGWRDIKLC